jgi:signal transduction histidine kinase/CheY-like chemotaxis protein
MFTAIVRGMIYLGSALMVYNIYRYSRFERHISERGDWTREKRLLTVPIVLLVLFLLGYLAVGLFGRPDLIIAGILFGGSVFVFLMILFMEQLIGRVQENERLEAKLTAAEESSRAKSSFLSRMSHEMRTPMNAIIGLNSMALKDPGLSLKTRDYLERIRVSAQHLLELINDILEMGRIESGRDELRQEVFSLPELLEQVNIMVQDQCREKGLNYQYSPDPTLEEYCLGDPLKLKQILINILGNAVKFTDAPGTVHFFVASVASYENHRTIRFVIDDTGIGMDEAFLPKLFQTFTQEDTTTTNQYGGSGLGMAITKNMVEMMNGDIQVKSEKGRGSTFTVTVTLDAAHAPAEAPAPEKRASAPAQEKSAENGAFSLESVEVLLAEDVDINAEIMADLLDMEGVTARWAKNGQEAVDLFQESENGHYAAIFMDIRMPVMDGLAAAKAIRKLDRPDAKTVPIIALTANAFQEDVQRSMQAGMNAHLSKPVDPNLLVDTLTALLQDRQE